MSAQASNTRSIVSAYPATSCSSRVLKDRIEIARDSSVSTSASESFAPSMRVDEPTLSIVATLRSALRRSGESVLSASHLPLNSSISAISFTRSGPNVSLGSFMAGARSYPILYPIMPDSTRFPNWLRTRHCLRTRRPNKARRRISGSNDRARLNRRLRRGARKSNRPEPTLNLRFLHQRFAQLVFGAQRYHAHSEPQPQPQAHSRF